MPSTYEVHGGVAYPPRQKFTGERCPECSFRGRHMSWCSRSTPVLAPSACRPEAPFPAKVIPIRPVSTTAAPTKTRGGLPQHELAYIEREIAWATGNGWSDVDRYRKLLVRNAKRRVAYVAAGLADPARPVFTSERFEWFTVDQNRETFVPCDPPANPTKWLQDHHPMFQKR